MSLLQEADDSDYSPTLARLCCRISYMHCVKLFFYFPFEQFHLNYFVSSHGSRSLLPRRGKRTGGGGDISQNGVLGRKLFRCKGVSRRLNCSLTRTSGPRHRNARANLQVRRARASAERRWGGGTWAGPLLRTRTASGLGSRSVRIVPHVWATLTVPSAP